MKDFEIFEKVYVIYGVASYVVGIISNIDGDKISVVVNKTIITTSWHDVYYDKPSNKKEFFIHDK